MFQIVEQENVKGVVSMNETYELSTLSWSGDGAYGYARWLPAHNAVIAVRRADPDFADALLALARIVVVGVGLFGEADDRGVEMEDGLELVDATVFRAYDEALALAAFDPLCKALFHLIVGMD